MSKYFTLIILYEKFDIFCILFVSERWCSQIICKKCVSCASVFGILCYYFHDFYQRWMILVHAPLQYSL
jgi:hypothetical protein